MKRTFALILTLILVLACTAFAELTETIDRFSDTWVDDGFSAEIWYDDEADCFRCDMALDDGSFCSYEHCRYDAVADTLICEDGVRYNATFNEDTADYDREVLSKGLTATFTEAGNKLTCEDSEGKLKDIEFLRLNDAQELMPEDTAANAVIAPQFTGIDTADATYPAAFNRDNLKDGTLSNVRIFTEDVYDIVDVSQMAVGDTFEAEGKIITIETLDTDEYGHININGGMDEEDGYTLTSEEDTNGFTTLLWDDFCTYTERGVIDLEMAEDIKLSDGWDIDGEIVTAAGIEAVTNAIMASANDSFYEHNTELVIENGKIVEINRRYVP